MGAPTKKTYKRSWRNLLLNKRYQLRFTLFMVGLSAVLMALLGLWVMLVARAATTVAENNVLGDEVCHDPSLDSAQAADDSPAPPANSAAPAAGAATGDSAAPPAAKAATGDSSAAGAAKGDSSAAGAATGDSAAAPAATGDSAAAAPDHARPVVTIEESDMQMVGPPPVPQTAATAAAGQAASRAAYEQCKRDQAVKLLEIESRQELIFWVLIAVGSFLCIGLLIYGIKMTHRVAGPLHKVGLYLAKLKDGRYEPVYNLRKGDRLVDFYEHFKHGYAGVRTLQEEDVARLKAMLAAAEEAQLAGRSPELAAALADLRALLEQKEKSLA